MRSLLRLVTIEMFLLFLLILSVASCADSDSRPLDAARSAVRDGDFARAVGFYQEHLEGQPDDYDVLKEYTFTLGERWAYDGGDRSPIIANLEQLYELRPSEEDVQGLLSLMLVREGQAGAEAGRFEEAEKIYRRAVAVNPEAGLAQYNLGILYDEQGKADAIKDVVGKSKNPSDSQARKSQGDVFVNGMKVRAISGADSTKLKIKTRKFN